jgi:alpha-glucosidase (family GH31 glycosyl hydrolase)
MFAKTLNEQSTTRYVDIMQQAIYTKYTFIRYYYTQLTLMQQGQIGTFYKPLYFEFPDDIKAYDETERNIMLGDALKLSVVSNELGTTKADFYFPAGTWCDLLKDNLKTDSCFTSTGEAKNLDADIGDYHVHLRGGKLIPW